MSHLEFVALIVRDYARMRAAGVEFVSAPRLEPYGQVAVCADLEGNRWDLLGPVAGT